MTTEACSSPHLTCLGLCGMATWKLNGAICAMRFLFSNSYIIIVEKNTFYCNDQTITEFGIIDSKNSSTAYVILYELIDTWLLDSNRRVGDWSLPWRWHILSILPLTTGRGTMQFIPYIGIWFEDLAVFLHLTLKYSLINVINTNFKSGEN